MSQSEVKKVLEERGKIYGDFSSLSRCAQEIKRTFKRHLKGSLNDEMEESLDLTATKLARILVGDAFNIDSWVDLAGYATLVADFLERIDRKSEENVKLYKPSTLSQSGLYDGADTLGRAIPRIKESSLDKA